MRKIEGEFIQFKNNMKFAKTNLLIDSKGTRKKTSSKEPLNFI